MAASKDDKDTKDPKDAPPPSPDDTPEPAKKDSKAQALAGTYKLLRGTFSSFATKDTKRDERLVPNGPLVSVSYKKGDRIRYDAADETRNVVELSAEQAHRFLVAANGRKYDPPRVEKV